MAEVRHEMHVEYVILIAREDRMVAMTQPYSAKSLLAAHVEEADELNVDRDRTHATTHVI